VGGGLFASGFSPAEHSGDYGAGGAGPTQIPNHVETFLGLGGDLGSFSGVVPAPVI